MRTILQRVSSAQVRVEGEEVARIERGVLALVGVEKGDGGDEVRAIAQKLGTLRLFEDEAGKMNLDLAAVDGGVLVVSQFTLAAALNRGRRPSFDSAAAPSIAQPLVEDLIEALRAQGLQVASGRFGAHMEVELVNDGPVTLVLEAREGKVLAPR